MHSLPMQVPQLELLLCLSQEVAFAVPSTGRWLL